MFYFNPATGESLWHHPQDDHWASLFTQCKDADGDLFERNEILTHELKVREGVESACASGMMTCCSRGRCKSWQWFLSCFRIGISLDGKPSF